MVMNKKKKFERVKDFYRAKRNKIGSYAKTFVILGTLLLIWFQAGVNCSYQNKLNRRDKVINILSGRLKMQNKKLDVLYETCSRRSNTPRTSNTAYTIQQVNETNSAADRILACNNRELSLTKEGKLRLEIKPLKDNYNGCIKYKAQNSLQSVKIRGCNAAEHKGWHIVISYKYNMCTSVNALKAKTGNMYYAHFAADGYLEKPLKFFVKKHNNSLIFIRNNKLYYRCLPQHIKSDEGWGVCNRYYSDE